MNTWRPRRMSAGGPGSFPNQNTGAGQGLRRGGGGDRRAPRPATATEEPANADALYARLAPAIDAAVADLDPGALAHAIRAAEAVEVNVARRLILRATTSAHESGTAQLQTLKQALQQLIDEHQTSPPAHSP